MLTSADQHFARCVAVNEMYCPKLKVVQLSGSHFSTMRAEHVSETAAALCDAIGPSTTLTSSSSSSIPASVSSNGTAESSNNTIPANPASFIVLSSEQGKGKRGRIGRAMSEVTRSEEPAKVAFLFSGQGSQYPNMGKELYQSNTAFREAIDRCSQILEPILGRFVSWD